MNKVYPVDALLAAAGLTPIEAARGLRIRVLLIGPAEAKALLAANIGNRPFRLGRVLYLARQMVEKNWYLTHQGIAFDWHGTAVDLQHRLMAIERANVTVALMVTEGLDPASFPHLDQHIRRTASDALRRKRGLVEEARFVLRLAASQSNPLLEELDDVCHVIEDLHDERERHCNTRAALTASVPVRVAALVLMEELPARSMDILAAYRALVLHHSQEWTPAMHAFQRKVATHSLKCDGHEARLMLFANALAALDPRKAQLSKLQVGDTTLASCVQRAKVLLPLYGLPAPSKARAVPRAAANIEARQ